MGKVDREDCALAFFLSNLPTGLGASGVLSLLYYQMLQRFVYHLTFFVYAIPVEFKRVFTRDIVHWTILNKTCGIIWNTSFIGYPDLFT